MYCHDQRSLRNGYESYTLLDIVLISGQCLSGSVTSVSESGMRSWGFKTYLSMFSVYSVYLSVVLNFCTWLRLA